MEDDNAYLTLPLKYPLHCRRNIAFKKVNHFQNNSYIHLPTYFNDKNDPNINLEFYDKEIFEKFETERSLVELCYT